MSRQSGLVTMKSLLISSIMWLFSSFVFSQGNIVQGIITDQKNYPIAGMVVYLESSDGLLRETQTNLHGRYYFENISRGSYVIKIENPRGWEYIKPRSGSYQIFIDMGGSGHNDWILKDPGIAIDFGNPPVINGDGTSGKNQGEPWLSMSLSGVQTLGNEKPLGIELEGEWRWSQGDSAILIAQASMAGSYSGGRISFENLGNNRFRLKLSSLGWPGFAFDGELARLQLSVKAPNQGFGEVSAKIHSMILVTPTGRKQILGRNPSDLSRLRDR